IPVDDDANGLSDRTVAIASPVFHALTLLSDLGPDYWVLPQQTIGGHTVGGFASGDRSGIVRIALFSHDAGDIQSRSDHSFRIILDLAGPTSDGRLNVTQYCFDRNHNTYFADAVRLRDAQAAADEVMRSAFAPAAASPRGYPRESVERIQELAALRPTAVQKINRMPSGRWQVTAPLTANGVNILVIDANTAE
ncbi:MAG: hypothetical protein HY000_39600, partial [Planctomycetes bacterium]|nr:hypothetical protein [Planctomycetota bacterium]